MWHNTSNSLLDDFSKEREFNPYEENGGTVAAIAGEDFVVIGADSRLTRGHIVHSRNHSRLFSLSDATVLGTSGCWSDSATLLKVVETNMKVYKQENNQTMSTSACAQMISVSLYCKRFFPYFTSNILAGIDKEGKGSVFGFDVIGHYERSYYRATGSAGPCIQPFLDSQIGMKNTNKNPRLPTLKRAVTVLLDAFTSGSERSVLTGDYLNIAVINKEGVRREQFELRKD